MSLLRSCPTAGNQPAGFRYTATVAMTATRSHEVPRVVLFDHAVPFEPDRRRERDRSGAANHFCVGAVLALTEVEVGTNQLLDRMEDIRFVGDPPTSVGVFTRAPVTMPLSFSPVGAYRVSGA